MAWIGICKEFHAKGVDIDNRGKVSLVPVVEGSGEGSADGGAAAPAEAETADVS